MKALLIQSKDALRAIPGMVTAIFMLSIVMMNLLANKSVNRLYAMKWDVILLVVRCF